MPRIKNPQLGQPQDGNIQLILFRSPNDSGLTLYLEVSTSHLGSLCLRPKKYLRFLGRCIMGMEGHVSLDSPHSVDDIGDVGELENHGVYSYRMAEGDDDPLDHAVNLNIFWGGSRTSRPSTYSQVSSDRRQLREAVSKRDEWCVVTGIEQAVCQASHIIPYESGDASIQSIVASRPNYDNDVSDLSVDDARNGVLVVPQIHTALDLMKIAFLKTPNSILHIEDVPIRVNRNLRDNTAYPADERITLQLTEDQGEPDRSISLDSYKIGRDAAFVVNSDVPRPSALLLDYKYGAAVVRWWGYHTGILRSHERPKNLAPAPGPSTSGSSNYPAGRYNLRESTMRKRERTGDTAGSSKKPRKKAVGGEESNTVDIVNEPVRESTRWNEFDWMDFFMSNTKAARERRRAVEEESSRGIRAWAQGVSGSH